MAGLHTPLSTLHVRPHDRPRMTRGRCGSLLLHRNGLAPSALCRSPGAPDTGRSIRLVVYRGESVVAIVPLDVVAAIGLAGRLIEATRRHLPSPIVVNIDPDLAKV